MPYLNCYGHSVSSSEVAQLRVSLCECSVSSCMVNHMVRIAALADVTLCGAYAASACVLLSRLSVSFLLFL